MVLDVLASSCSYFCIDQKFEKLLKICATSLALINGSIRPIDLLRNAVRRNISLAINPCTYRLRAH